MCGLIGYSGKDPLDQANIKILFLFSQTRGDFASGLWTKDGIKKGNDKASYFIAKEQIPKQKVLIGHTRNPSRNTGRGEDNAQPFEFDKIVGAHNGYCYGLTKYGTDKKLRNDASDSYLAFHFLNNNNLQKTKDKITNTSNYTFLWYNKEDDTVNFYKFGKTLFYGYIDGNMYIASEKEFLEAIDCVDIESASINTHYKVKDGEIIDEKSVKSSYTPPPRSNRNHVNQTSGDNIPKICSKTAPEDAEAIMQDGVKRYYWLEDKVLYVESCYSPADTELEGFDLSKEGGSEKAARKHLDIVNNVNKQLS